MIQVREEIKTRGDRTALLFRRSSSSAWFGFVYDSSYQFALHAVYVCIVPWSEFPIVPFYPLYVVVSGPKPASLLFLRSSSSA